jgi:hypothetical protein
MWRVAVRGGVIPHQALAMALRRVTIAIIGDDPISHAGIGLIKAFHVRQQGGNRMGELCPSGESA